MPTTPDTITTVTCAEHHGPTHPDDTLPTHYCRQTECAPDTDGPICTDCLTEHLMYCNAAFNAVREDA